MADRCVSICHLHVRRVFCCCYPLTYTSHTYTSHAGQTHTHTTQTHACTYTEMQTVLNACTHTLHHAHAQRDLHAAPVIYVYITLLSLLAPPNCRWHSSMLSYTPTYTQHNTQRKNTSNQLLIHNIIWQQNQSANKALLVL